MPYITRTSQKTILYEATMVDRSEFRDMLLLLLFFFVRTIFADRSEVAEDML